MEDYRGKGYEPLALINYVMRNGAGLRGHQPDNVYTLEQLVDMFDLGLLRENRQV